MKKCPFCAEEIQDAAIVCKHCGRDLKSGLHPSAERQPSYGIAALLSLIIPGAGQMYLGRVGQGFVWLVATVAGYMMLVVPGVIVHICCIIAAATKPMAQQRREAAATTRGAAPATTPPSAPAPGIAPAPDRTPAAQAPDLPTKKLSRPALLAVALAFVGMIGFMVWAYQKAAAPDQAMTPNEPCAVDAPIAYRSSAQIWCSDGLFTKVNVSTDPSNFVVILQFSKKGQDSWTRRQQGILNQFRVITNEMVEKTYMNVAFSLHDPKGDMVGGCARQRSARNPTCKAN